MYLDAKIHRTRRSVVPTCTLALALEGWKMTRCGSKLACSFMARPRGEKRGWQLGATGIGGRLEPVS